MQLDVTDFARIDELSAQFKDQPIDVLLSNAAITPRYKTAFKPVSGMDYDMAQKKLRDQCPGAIETGRQFYGAGCRIRAEKDYRYVE